MGLLDLIAGTWLLLGLILWLGQAATAAAIANWRGLRPVNWFIGSLLLGPFAIPLALLTQIEEDDVAPQKELS